MSTLVYPSSLKNGTEADAGQVNELFDAVTGIVNGHLDASNLKFSAGGIPTGTFQQDAGIVTGCFGDLAVDSQLVAPQFAINSRVQVFVPTGLAFSTNTTILAQFASVSVVGPRPVRVVGVWALTVRPTSAAAAGHVIVTWLRSGVPLLQVSMPMVYQILVKTPVSMVPLVDVPPPGTFDYTLLAKTDNANLILETPGGNAGLFWLEQAT